MGCITSKVMSKSISFREDLNQSLQRRSNNISSMEELINKTDQFLGLVCRANMVESLTSETPDHPKQDIVQVSTQDIEAWEVAAKGGQERQSHVTSRLVQSSSTSPVMDVEDIARRSKSCHWFPEYDEFSCKEDEASSSVKIRGRARSIHTVEEYDAILEKLWLSRSNDESTDENKISTQTSVVSSSGLGTVGADTTSSSTEHVVNADKGLKRKAVAKGLESLSVPQAIEFQNVGSHKEGLQVYSPGAYVTPKFGSYALPSSSSSSTNESASVAFNPELVAAFEECMQQLQAEEDIVLKQIAQDFGEESNNELSKDIQVQI